MNTIEKKIYFKKIFENYENIGNKDLYQDLIDSPTFRTFSKA